MITQDQKAVLEKYDILNREEFLFGLFMEKGPVFLCNYLGFESNSSKEWNLVFDYFVLERNILFSLSKRYYDHFKFLYENYGPQKVRKILGISVKKYDHIWLPIHDLFGVAEGALVKYISNSRFTVARDLKIYGSERVRENLDMLHSKYDVVWKQALDVLLEHQTEMYLAESNPSRLLEVFDAQMNLRREHVVLT